MVTVSSAFMSSRRARAIFRVSSASGRDFETDDAALLAGPRDCGFRSKLKQQQVMLSGTFPFLTCDAAPGATLFHPMHVGLMVSIRQITLDSHGQFSPIAVLSSVEDSGDFRPCRNIQAGGRGIRKPRRPPLIVTLS